MKMNTPVSNHEINFPDDAKIISTTDLKGALNYFNQDFLDISGFSEEELLGQNHNIVRHPDMPTAAFHNLWETVQQGKPWMGVVKNRCKNGDFYWVDAYVTPIYDGREITGYQSVRVKPSKEKVARAKALYKQVSAGKKFWFSRLLSSKMIVKQWLSHSFNALLSVAAFAFLQQNELSNNLNIFITLGISLGLALLLAKSHSAPWTKAAQQAKHIFDNDIARQVYTGRSDELGCLQSTIMSLQAKLNTVLVRLDDSNTRLVQTASQTSRRLHTTLTAAQQQQDELHQVSSSLEEMTATIHEVATSANSTSGQIQQARDSAQDGAMSAVETLGSMDTLMDKISETVNVIHILESDSSGIGTVVEVIRGIAEQTNLLALNAAIEAARAGEQGRGFAVVADEVRSLAQRTQSSTQEIEDIVKKLQEKAVDSASMMTEASQQGEKCSEFAEAAAESLGAVAAAVSNIGDTAIQIATSTEQQTAAAEEINRNISIINQLAIKTAEETAESAQSSDYLLEESEKLKTMTWQFS